MPVPVPVPVPLTLSTHLKSHALICPPDESLSPSLPSRAHCATRACGGKNFIFFWSWKVWRVCAEVALKIVFWG